MWAGVPTAPFFPDSRLAVDADPSSEAGRYAAIRSGALPGRADIPDQTVDSARAEFEAGRYWHASQMLREHGTEGAVLTPSEVLLLARADAGWKNWGGVLTGLEGADWLDEVGGGEGSLLVARALEAAERWVEAAQQYAHFRSTGAIARGDSVGGFPGGAGRGAGRPLGVDAFCFGGGRPKLARIVGMDGVTVGP